MDDPQAAAEQNRRSWNAVVPVHASHRSGEAGFLAAGGLTIFPEEQALLGDLKGLRLLHLMCNAGQDTLSFANLGAEVVGVDISDAAIESARMLAVAAGIPATFVRADVYDYLDTAVVAGERYERIYCGYGAICWLYDVARFAAGVAALLAPGGRFVLLEFHPLSNIFDREWRLIADYPQAGATLDLDGVGDYVGAAAGGLSPAGFAPGVAGFVNPHGCRLYRWGLGEVVSAFCTAGLRPTALHEYGYVNGERPFAGMRSAADRRNYPPETVPRIPLMYGFAAER
ncbi:MAG: class I SAM-dependent methyltransferase [Oscillochloris sp.]|nr:class I SAM-dependent methyltransferase [Oscillochloris sp.]